MKYIEELMPGDFFEYNQEKYILTCDMRFNKKREQKLSIKLSSGMPRWMDSGLSVDCIQLYEIDSDKNIIAIKEYKDEFTENQNIH